MRQSISVLALIALLPGTGLACSLASSPEFELNRAQRAPAAPPRIEVRRVNFVPSMDAGDSCDGIGFISIELTLPKRSDRQLKNYGFFVRPLSGVNGKEFFPTYPLALAPRMGRHASTISWGWTGITPDPDGQVRWKLEVVPVSSSGVLGEPMTVCASSDDSCPEPAGNAP